MGFRESLGEAMGQLACSAANSIGTLGDGVAFPLGFTGGAVARLLAYKTSALFCNKDPYTDPFKPGLCPIKYLVTITYRITGHPNPVFNGTFTKTAYVWGEVGTAGYERLEADDPGGRQVARVSLVSYGSADGPRAAAPIREFYPQEEFHELATLVILNVESVPDPITQDADCDDSYSPAPYDPNNFTRDIDINVDLPDTTSYSLPLTVVIGQLFVDANLDLNMPFTFNVKPTANLNLSFNPTFKASLNLSTGETRIDFDFGDNFVPPAPGSDPRPDKPGTRPDQPAPTKPPGVPDAEPDPDDEAADRTIIAAIVTTTVQGQPARLTVIGQDSNPDIYVPNLGLISFAIQTKDGAVGWTNDIPIKNERAYVPCPEPRGAISVRGTPQPGNEFVITPIYDSALLPAEGG